MENYYLALLVFLGIVAAFDIFVGVSNDAVNFLQSAVGSRIASFKTIMCTAAAGVLLGSTFSSGMMEVARSGIFYPQMFNFEQIMVIFFAVMVADIILLDMFNTLGLPTSTTVSIVFELLGSALAAASVTLWQQDASVGEIVHYINSSKALTIISGILISVVVAFITGALVQYVTRLIFTFNFERTYQRLGGVFAGLALTAIVYFLIMKGAKGASFMRPEWLAFMKVHTLTIVTGLFVGLSIVFQILITVFNTNVFKIVILSGTFALAFAFAGNDLVNFVGVPLAAWDAYKEWTTSGSAPDALMMTSLAGPSKASTLILLASGLVMVGTLFFSRKALRVIRTSINLSASHAAEKEQFGSSAAGRMIVRASMHVGTLINQFIPGAVKKRIDTRFTPKQLERDEEPLPFDYVRASINLMVSAALIASATSLKLPLSTTYVTFMVAMGSSFADRAWDRESAVYRVSGVLTVISGWFVTALAASTLAALVCGFTLWAEELGASVMALIAVLLLVRSNIRARREEEAVTRRINTRYNTQDVSNLIQTHAGEHVVETVGLYGVVARCFLEDDEKELKATRNDCATLVEALKSERSLYYSMATSRINATKADMDARYCYYRIYSNLRAAAGALENLSTLAYEHCANRHRVFAGELRNDLEVLTIYLQEITESAVGRADLDNLLAHAQEAGARIDSLQAELLRRIPHDKLSLRGSELYLTFLQAARLMVNHFAIAAMMQKRLRELAAQETDKPASAESSKSSP